MTADDDVGEEQRRRHEAQSKAALVRAHFLSGGLPDDALGGTTHQQYLSKNPHSLIRSSSSSSGSRNAEMCNRSCSSPTSSYHWLHLHPSHPTSQTSLPPQSLTVGHLLRTPIIQQEDQHRRQSPPTNQSLIMPHFDDVEDEQVKNRRQTVISGVDLLADQQEVLEGEREKRLKRRTRAKERQWTAVDGGTYLAHNRLPRPQQLPEEDQKSRHRQLVVDFGEKQQQQQSKWPEKKRSSGGEEDGKECSSKTPNLKKSTTVENSTTATSNATSTVSLKHSEELVVGGGGSRRDGKALLHHEDPMRLQTSSTAAANKPCFSQRRLQFTSDTDAKQVDDEKNARIDHQVKNNSALTETELLYTAKLSSPSQTSLCLPLGDHQLSPKTSSTLRTSESPLSKTANPAVLRAKLCSARFAAESASSGSYHLEDEQESEKDESLGTESLLPTGQLSRSSSGSALARSRAGHASRFSSALSHYGRKSHPNHLSSSSTFSSSGIVSWTELRNKLIKLQKKAASHQRRKHQLRSKKVANLRITSPLSSRHSNLTGTSSSTSTTSKTSSSASKQRQSLHVNRNLLAEFRRRFRRSSNSSSLLYFDNPVSATHNKAVNYSYSYYNFFYYPPTKGELHQQEKSPIYEHSSAPGSTLVRHGCETERNLQRNHFNQQTLASQTKSPYNHHHHLAAPTSLTSLLSTTSTTSSSLITSPSSSTPLPTNTTSLPPLNGPCCNQHYYHCNLESAVASSPTERNLLLPHSASDNVLTTSNTQQQQSNYLRRFGFGGQGLLPYPHHHHHHHHHRNSLCASLLEGDSKGNRHLNSANSTASIAASDSFHHHKHSHSSSEEDVSSTSSNNCCSTIMEILPLLLLLTMGVIISTTCAKYTFHTPSMPAKTAASSSAAYHHRFSGANPFDETSLSGMSPNVKSGGHHSHNHDGGETKASNSRSSSSERGETRHSPEPPYLMMMQNDDEYSSSNSRSAETGAASAAESSVESYDEGERGQFTSVDESMKKSSTVVLNGQHNPNHYNQHQKQASLAQQAAGTGNGNNQQSMLAQLAHQYAAMQLKWVANASVSCNDGTRAGYYIRANSSSRRWLIYLEGGWYCMSKSTCDQRWAKMREFMTSFRWTQFKTCKYIFRFFMLLYVLTNFARSFSHPQTDKVITHVVC